MGEAVVVGEGVAEKACADDGDVPVLVDFEDLP